MHLTRSPRFYRLSRRFLPAICLAIALAGGDAAFAQNQSPLLRDSFPIGNDDGILCQVQDRSIENPAKRSIFDRSWAVVCRDSARPVSIVYAFRAPANDALERIAPHRREPVVCATGGAAEALPGALRTNCRVNDTKLDWSIYRLEQDGIVYVAEGFSAYDSATLLALKSVANNAIATGTIDVATTSVTDPLAFARVQAETLKPDQALAEGYRRNLSGEYAEAAAYFETLQQRLAGDSDQQINEGEFLVNRALQKSNLGEFAEADRLFAEAEPLTLDDPIAARLQRNFEAIHMLNQGFYESAVERLNIPVRTSLKGAEALIERLEISTPVAARLNGDEIDANLLGFVDELTLTPEERAEIIDAQALQLKGTAWRILGEPASARAALLDAYNRAIAVRDGRVTSITRLRTQILTELAILAEDEGKFGDAETYMRNGLAILEAQYPEKRAVAATKARLGAFLLRRAREEEGLALYREVVDSVIGRRNAATGFENQLRPYFSIIADRVESDPAAAEEFFKATQILVRPGVAETQAILSRELSSGSDEAARLFRQSTDLARAIEKLRISYAALGKAEQTAAVRQRRTELAEEIERLERSQQSTQVRLNDYPQYRAVANRAMTLGEFRDQLLPGEAYARLAVVSGRVFLFYTDREQAKAYPVTLSETDLDGLVDQLRASIALFENGRYVTYPYDIQIARTLYQEMFAPISAEIVAANHLIFEPDGALLRLPIDILIADDASVATYLARSEGPDGDAYDFTGVNWLGRNTRVSTAVSAQAFVDARRAAPSGAAREYLGLGKNVPIGNEPNEAIRATLVSGGNACGWSVNEWNRPIDDGELRAARALIGEGRSEIVTGAAFTDRNLLQREDLDEFRVLHFATHGLVTPPNPACPARPALLTSFGTEGSDGLLSFEEIFDLDLDADIIILSACDTAGEASIVATREAGVGSGGGTALDGLVRSFIGAGSRSVLASHWPVPDDYDATQRLINGLFRNGKGASIADALSASRSSLMNAPLTSHPYYWAGFAIIGDGARTLLATDRQLAATRADANGGAIRP